VFERAASLGHGVAKAHAFVDGNMRTELLTMQTFLFLNGYRLHPDPVAVVTTMEGVASGEVFEAELARWLGRLVEDQNAALSWTRSVCTSGASCGARPS